MQTQTKFLISIGVIILVVIGFSLGSSEQTPQLATTTDGNVTVTETTENNNSPAETVTEVDGSPTTEVDEQIVSTVTQPKPTAGKYLDYDANAVASSEAENIVLSFHATWCPSCRTLEKDINASLSDIPSGTEIYKVDYDTNLELRKKYGITTQHTHVVIDSEGNMIKKWVGSNTLEQFVAKI